jgi:hypothetical protein
MLRHLWTHHQLGTHPFVRPKKVWKVRIKINRGGISSVETSYSAVTVLVYSSVVCTTSVVAEVFLCIRSFMVHITTLLIAQAI